MMDWLAGVYVRTLNVIHYMQRQVLTYEAAEMALIDTDVRRSIRNKVISRFSHVVDSLSAIKYAKVKTVRDENGVVVDFETEGDFPRYGNDDDRADEIAVWLLKTFMAKIKKCHTYRNSEPTTSILTITSNVVYGKATASLPDGRKAVNHFHRVLTHHTVQNKTVWLHHLTQLLNCHMSMLLTVFQIHKQLTLTLLVTKNQNRLQTL